MPREALRAEDLPDALVEKIRNARMDPRHSHLNERRVLRLEDMTEAQVQEMADAEIPEGQRYRLSDIPG